MRDNMASDASREAYPIAEINKAINSVEGTRKRVEETTEVLWAVLRSEKAVPVFESDEAVERAAQESPLMERLMRLSEVLAELDYEVQRLHERIYL